MNWTEVSSGNLRSRSSARVWERRESPESSRAKEVVRHRAFGTRLSTGQIDFPLHAHLIAFEKGEIVADRKEVGVFQLAFRCPAARSRLPQTGPDIDYGGWWNRHTYPRCRQPVSRP